MLIAGVLVFAAGSSANADNIGPINVVGDPVAPPPQDSNGKLLDGAGLCGAFRLADKSDSNLLLDMFPNRPMDFPNDGPAQLQSALNGFIDGTRGPSTPPASFATLLTPFDLASLTVEPGANGIGDYKNIRECVMSYSPAGCQFPASGDNLAKYPEVYFGTRFRGFLLIKEGEQNQFVHYGFRTQSEVVMRVFQKADKDGAKAYDVVSRSVNIGIGDWRVTNSVTFAKPGLYPIEILHASNGNPASLEMGWTRNVVTDFDGQSSSTNSLNMIYTLMEPANFFQTSSGALPYGTAAECKQCPRSQVNKPGGGGACDQGFFCNEAAVCSPCIGDQFCGNSCTICAGSPLPYCVRQPGAGMDYACAQCRYDADCKSGQACIQGTCKSPCNCCQQTTPYCIVTDDAQPDAKNCSECSQTSDCADGKVCDRLNARCVDKLADCNDDEHCGPTCINCITGTVNDPQGRRPHCLNGTVCAQCRNDVDCAAGSYCRSGDCVPCTHDRHCGASCRSCGVDLSINPDGTTASTATEKPYCLAPNGDVPKASCVQCLIDENCGPGGTCDPGTKTCSTACAVACPAGKVCSGIECVECTTSSQCACGQCIGGLCTPTCGDSTDCMGNQCCAEETATCVTGRCKPGLTAHGGALCCDATGGALSAAKDPAAPRKSPLPLVALLAALGVLVALRLRGLRTGTPPGQRPAPDRQGEE